MELPLTAPTTGTVADWVPVDSCTLPTREQPLRVAEFDHLFAAGLRAVERQHASATQARLVLAGDEGLASRVQALAEAETSCCSFFTFTVTTLTPDAGVADRSAVALDIEVPAARADVLAALVERAQRARRAAA
jgi:hypothetical protein